MGFFVNLQNIFVAGYQRKRHFISGIKMSLNDHNSATITATKMTITVPFSTAT